MCTTCGCSTEDHHHEHDDHDHEHHHNHDGHGHHHHLHKHGDHHHDHEHDHKGHKRDKHHHHHDHEEGSKKISVETAILAKNDRLAAGNRELFREKGVFALNLVSSPGSGKTTILERTLKDLAGKFKSGVSEDRKSRRLN